MKNAAYQTHRLDWLGFEIEVRYCPSWLVSGAAHIEVECLTGDPLPITSTGYRSHFTRPENIEAEGGPAAFVQAWLDQEASNAGWKKADADRRQMCLF